MKKRGGERKVVNLVPVLWVHTKKERLAVSGMLEHIKGPAFTH